MEARKLSTMEGASPPQKLTLNSLETAVYSFPPHRRRPLRSRTYDAIIRILSHCSTGVPQHQMQGKDKLLISKQEFAQLTRCNEVVALVLGFLLIVRFLSPFVWHTCLTAYSEIGKYNFICLTGFLKVQFRMNIICFASSEVHSGDFELESVSNEAGSITLNEADSSDVLVPLPHSKGSKDAVAQDHYKDTLAQDNSKDNTVAQDHSKDTVAQDDSKDMVAQDDSKDESNNTGLQNVGLDGKQAIVPKLHHINSVTDGKQEVTPSNRISIEDFLVVENQTADNAIQNAKEQENVKSFLDIQMDDFEVDNEFGIHDFSKVIESCFDMDMIVESSKVGEDGHDKVVVLESIPKDAERELQLKEMELEKLIHSSDGLDSSFHQNADEEIEEGEISGEAGVADESFDALSNDVTSFGERTTEKMHASENCLDNEKLICNDEDRGHLQHETSNRDSSSMVMEIRTPSGQIQSCFYQNFSHDIHIDTKKSGALTPCSENLTPSGRIIRENAAENPISSTSEKDDDASNKKRKRGPLTKEKRAKKKKKERIKRAEKNRQLGVKRLKLQPNLKPKKIVYCRHYLQGRCHEGDKCNFSHDTVPLTKSKPCSHFARHSCMKGDECPFDHQLSNYPCTNYTSNGFCNRGSECLFSHEIPAKSCSITPSVSKPDLMSAQHTVSERGGSTPISNFTKPELKFISPLNSSNSNKMDIHGVLHKKVDAKYCSASNSPAQSAELQAVKPVSRTGGQPPRGVSFLSNRGMSLGDTNKNKRDGSSEKTSDSVSSSSEVIRKVPSGVSELNKISDEAAPRKPRGLNFLSFGQPSADDSSGKIFSIFPSKSNNGTVKSVKDDTGKGKHTCLWSQSGGILEVNRQMNASATNSPSDLNEKVNGTPSTIHQHLKLLSFNRDDSIGKETADLQFNKGNAVLPFVKERASTSKLEDTIKRPSLSFGGKNANLSCSFTKSFLSNSPSLVQKAVQSTLAFAEKLDPDIKAGASLHQRES